MKKYEFKDTDWERLIEEATRAARLCASDVLSWHLAYAIGMIDAFLVLTAEYEAIEAMMTLQEYEREDV